MKDLLKNQKLFKMILILYNNKTHHKNLEKRVFINFLFNFIKYFKHKKKIKD